MARGIVNANYFFRSSGRYSQRHHPIDRHCKFVGQRLGETRGGIKRAAERSVDDQARVRQQAGPTSCGDAQSLAEQWK